MGVRVPLIKISVTPEIEIKSWSNSIVSPLNFYSMFLTLSLLTSSFFLQTNTSEHHHVPCPET